MVSPDRQDRSREILSPAVARNAYASFRVAVRIPENSGYTLYVGQNPENAVRVTLYREEAAGVRIPDKLTKVEQPALGKMGPGELAHTYWLDVWVAPDAPVRRIKVEAQLHAGGGWINYPMEVRVVPAIVPKPMPSGGPLPEPGAPADASAWGPLRDYLCGTPPAPFPRQLSVRGLIRRNALQDMALARKREQEYGRAAVFQKLAGIAGAHDTDSWCREAARLPRTNGPEWYLRIRDLLYHGW